MKRFICILLLVIFFAFLLKLIFFDTVADANPNQANVYVKKEKTIVFIGSPVEVFEEHCKNATRLICDGHGTCVYHPILICFRYNRWEIVD